MKRIDFTQTDQSMIEQALSVAADKYDDIALHLRRQKAMPRLADQFETQAKQARNLMNVIMDCDAIYGEGDDE